MDNMYISIIAGIVLCYFAFAFCVRLVVNYHLPKLNQQLVEINKTLKRIEKQNAALLAANNSNKSE